MELGPGLDVLPAEQEPEEVLRRGGFDLPAQAAQRQAVDAREQRPLAPLGLRRTGSIASAQHQPIVLQRRQFCLHVRNAELASELGSGDGTGDPDPAADRIEQLRAGPFGGAPEPVAEDGTASGAQLLQPWRPGARLGLWQQHQREQQVVKLVGRTKIRRGLPDHLRDGLCVQGSQRCGVARIERAPQLHGPRPPLLQRRVVQVSVRSGVENLV